MTQSLLQAGIEKFGSVAAVDHQISLLNRRLRYAAVQPGPRSIPEPGVAWPIKEYITEFERLNRLRITAATLHGELK